MLMAKGTGAYKFVAVQTCMIERLVGLAVACACVCQASGWGALAKWLNRHGIFYPLRRTSFSIGHACHLCQGATGILKSNWMQHLGSFCSDFLLLLATLPAVGSSLGYR